MGIVDLPFPARLLVGDDFTDSRYEWQVDRYGLFESQAPPCLVSQKLILGLTPHNDSSGYTPPLVR